MWAWLRSPRGSTATATAVATILALFWFAPWSRPLPPFLGGPAAPATLMSPPQQDAAVSAASLPSASPGQPDGKEAKTADQPTDGTAATSAPAVASASENEAGKAQPGSGAAGAASPAPAFDVVRVEPSGAAVIAGRGEPGSTVTLMDVGRPIAHVTVDPSGQFALLPPDLAEGNHYLTLESGASGQLNASKQGVAIALGKAGVNKPLVAMLSPDGPARILSDGGPISPFAGGAAPAPAAVAIQAVEAAAGGRFTVSGVAKPGSQARLYLNGSFLADVTAAADGRWAVRVEKGMRPGPYVVRADELAPGSATVVHRAEVPFTYPAMVAGAGRKELLASRPAPTASSAPTALADNLLAGAGRVSSAAPGATQPHAASAPTAGPAIQDQMVAGASVAGHRPEKQQVLVATAGAPADDAGAGSPVIAAIVSDLKTATVTRGDSLWRISRRLLGKGVNYTEIYASNAAQIRNPALIYPGQVFVLPSPVSK